MSPQRKGSLDPLHAWHSAAAGTLPGLSILVYDLDLSMVSFQGDPPLSPGLDPAGAVGRPLSEILPPRIWSKMESSFREALSGSSSSFEMPFSDGDCLHWIEVAPLRRDGTVIGGVMSSQEVAERLIAEQELLEVTGSFEAVFSKAPIGMAMIALDGSLIRVNPSFNRISGYTSEETAHLRIQDMIPPEDHERDLLMTSRLVGGEMDNYVTEKRLIGKSGREIWVMMASSVSRDDEGAPLHLVVQLQDVTDRKELEIELRRVAGEDPLTGLANRRRLEETLRNQIARCHRYDEKAALLMIDLDDFKSVNDTYGHSTGDDLLVFVADQLRGRLRSSDLVARPGGDEFAVIAVDSDGDQARVLVAELTEHFDALRFDPRGRDLGCQASIGSAVIDSSTESTDEVLSSADRSMYRAKNARRSAASPPSSAD